MRIRCGRATVINIIFARGHCFLQNGKARRCLKVVSQETTNRTFLADCLATQTDKARAFLDCFQKIQGRRFGVRDWLLFEITFFQEQK